MLSEPLEEDLFVKQRAVFVMEPDFVLPDRDPVDKAVEETKKRSSNMNRRFEEFLKSAANQPTSLPPVDMKATGLPEDLSVSGETQNLPYFL